MARCAVEETIVTQATELPSPSAPLSPPAQCDAVDPDETDADWAEDAAIIAARLGAPIRFD